MSKYIRWLFYILIFLIPLLMSSATSEIFEFNKVLFLYAMTVVIATSWLVKKFFYKEKISFHWLLHCFGVFLLSQLVSTVFSIDLQTSVFGYYGRFNGGLLSIIAYITLFYIFYDVFNKQNLLTFLKVSLISSTLVMLWGLPGRFGADLSCALFTGSFSNSCWTDQFRPAERMFSTLGQPNWLGAYLAIHFFIGLYFFLRSITDTQKNSLRNQLLFGLYIVFNFLTLLFTRSRSSLGAVGIALVFFIGIFLWRIRMKLSPAFIMKLGVIGLIFFVSLIIFKTGIEKIDRYLGLVPVAQKQQSTIKPVPNPNILVTDSLDIRKVVWNGAIKLGLQYPLFGTGVETFAYSYYFVRPTEHNLTSEWDFIYNKAHNEFLNYLATTGFFGLITYVLVIMAVIYVYIRGIIQSPSQEDKLLYLCLVCSYMTIQITNFFGFSTTTVNLFFYILAAVPLLAHKVESQAIRRQNKFTEFTAYITIGIGLFLLWSLLRYYLADISYAKGNRYLEADEYQQAMSAYSDALDLKYEHVYEDRLSGTLANLGIMAYLQNEKDLSQRLIELAKAYNQKTLRAAPQNVLYWKTKAKNDYLFYQADKDKKYLDEAIESLHVAEAIAPTDPKIPYTIALFYVDLYQNEQKESDKTKYFTEAQKYIKKSLQLKPNYLESLDLQKELESNN